MKWYSLIKISRWRFWLYLGGTYLIGYTAGIKSITQFYSLTFWLFLSFFLIPANLFLYGINDIYDRETDALNPKKNKIEHKLVDSEVSSLRISIISVLALAFFLLVFNFSIIGAIIFLSFILLSVAYSMPPIRFKAMPFFDSFSNILYAIPGFLGYYHSTGNFVSIYAVIAAVVWTSAMHLFSAIPDIQSDRRSGLYTSASIIGREKSLVICFFLWSVFSFIAISLKVLWPWCLISLLYPLITLILFIFHSISIDKIYWYYPMINGFIGFITFFLLVSNI